MKSYRFEAVLGAVLAAIYGAVWYWQHRCAIGGPLSSQEIDTFMLGLEKLPTPPEEQAGLLSRARTWMESDDGKPLYMLNLMRYYTELRRFPGAPDSADSPQQSNARYESAVMNKLLKVGGYPAYAGTFHGKNLMEYSPTLDDWGRLLLVRYPSRRAFMQLVTDPAYAEIEPYKVMAMQVVLSPTRAEMLLPNVTWLAGGILLSVFVAVGWLRAAYRGTS